MSHVVVYVERNIAGGRRGQVLTVEWSDHWAGHESAGNVRVVREEVYEYDPPVGDPVPVGDDSDFIDEIEAERDDEVLEY